MELFEFETLSLPDWAGLMRSDPGAFGGGTEGLQVRQKDRYVGVRDDDGRLIAVIGAAIAQVTVEGHGSFEVVGIGGLMVRKDARALGLGSQLMERIREITTGWGPDRAMLFCEPHLTAMYTRRGYTQLPDEVWVDQPTGPITMPIHAMWRPIRPADWPPGVIHLHGPPF